MKSAAITDQELSRRHKMAKRYFWKTWPKHPIEVGEEFAAYCVEKWLKGRKIDTSLNYMVIDYFREFGNAGRSKPMDIMRSGQRVYYDTPQGVSIRKGAVPKELADYEAVSALLKPGLKDRERVAISLYFKFNFRLSEVGYVLGVSESAVSLLLNRAIASQKRDALKSERFANKKNVRKKK